MTEPSDFDPYPSGLPVPDRPPRLPAPGHLVGRAQGVQLRTESDPYVADRLITVLGFRLQVPDRPQPVEVELRGRSLTGAVRDGDWVEVPEKPAATGIYSVDTVANLSTGVPVTVAGPTASAGRTVFAVLFVIIFLVILGIVIAGFIGFFASY